MKYESCNERLSKKSLCQLELLSENSIPETEFHHSTQLTRLMTDTSNGPATTNSSVATSTHLNYQSPLTSRYASPEMAANWGDDKKVCDILVHIYSRHI